MSRFFKALTPKEHQKLREAGIDIDSSYVRFLIGVSPTWAARNLPRLSEIQPDMDEIQAHPVSPEEWRDWLPERPREIPLAVVW